MPVTRNVLLRPRALELQSQSKHSNYYRKFYKLTINSPDTATAFQAYQPFLDAANNALIPQGYSLAFLNLQGSSQTTSYLGYKTLSSYDTVACASYCDQLDGCIAFNIYYERDPSITPAASCPNPSSVTNIKCVRWGVQIQQATATNTGENRSELPSNLSWTSTC